jgi:hypothetical protein
VDINSSISWAHCFFVFVYLKQLPLTVQGDGLSAPGNGELLGTFRLG